MDLGFEMNGFDIEFVNVFHPAFMNAYKYSREQMKLRKPKYGYFNGDINDFLSERKEELNGWMKDARTDGTAETITPGINTCGGDLNTEFSYDVLYTVKDQFTTVTYIDYVSTAIYLMHFLHGGRGVAFGQKATMEWYLDCAFKALFRDQVFFMTGNGVQVDVRDIITLGTQTLTSFGNGLYLCAKDACGMKSIPEEPVKAAFATMMNKLTWGRSRVLLPYAEMLKEGMNAETLGRLSELETLMEKNAERRAQITQFFTKGLLDPAVYAEESDALTEEMQRLSDEQNLLTLQVSGSHERQEALERLLKYTAKGRILTEFDDALFTEHVDHIVVYERTEIGFAMKCGPIFRERI